MSRVIVKVVVVVVVMIRAGSFGSADLFDCENLSDDRFWQASSLEKSVRTRSARAGREQASAERTDVVNEFG
jgi:hypothetical protein